jgi:hypothetical protein
MKHAPHYTTLQKFASRIPSALLDRIIKSFLPEEHAPSASLIIGVDASGFKPSKASSYYTQSFKPRKKKRYVKCTLAVELKAQLVCSFKARRIARHDVVDFMPVLEKASLPSGVTVVADKAYDAETCHVYVRERLNGYTVIPPRHEGLPVWKTKGRYRKQMRRGYPEAVYHQRSKDETVFSVVKRVMTEHLASRMVRTQNRELAFRLIAYNAYRLINKT